MASKNSEVLLRAFALILLGFHCVIFQIDAGQTVGIDEDGKFVASEKKQTFKFEMYPKDVPIPPPGFNRKKPTNSYTNVPPTSFTILENESKFNFGMYPKGVPIPPSGPSRRSSADKYTPPPPPLSGPRYRPPWDVPCRHPNPPRYCVLLRPPLPPSPRFRAPIIAAATTTVED